MTGLGPLRDGGRVAIIGGGPAGVGCALALKRLAKDHGCQLAVTLFEGKQFTGARHHNLCVGVVSPPLPSLLEDVLGVPYPEHLRQGVVTGYTLHTEREAIDLDDAKHPSYALRRVQFDEYMLQMARERGVNVVSARVVEVEFHADRVLVYSESSPVEADVVVGAFGLDAGAGGLFQQTVGYRQPSTLASVLTRYHPGEAAMAAFGPRVHAFLTGQPRVEFGAISPKSDHLTINVAGAGVGAEEMLAFLRLASVRAVLPGYADADEARKPIIYKGRFPRSLAGRYYGDRYVMAGDAAGLVRAFKGKGVTSALQTGIRAAETILQAGISERAFADHYCRANQDIVGDLGYGRLVRTLVLASARVRLIDPVIRAARRDANVRRALFGAVSAHQSYSAVLGDMMRPAGIASVLRAMLPSTGGRTVP